MANNFLSVTIPHKCAELCGLGGDGYPLSVCYPLDPRFHGDDDGEDFVRPELVEG